MKIADFWAHVDTSGGPDACWPWRQHCDKKWGYGKLQVPHTDAVTLRALGVIPDSSPKRPHALAHRVAYGLTKGAIGAGMRVCHTCDNPPCCNPRHHFEGTHTDNMRDSLAKGRFVTADRTSTHKLTAEQVRWLRGPESGSARGAGRVVGVSHTTVQRIRARKQWKAVA